jgi:hypothetical protein
MSGDADFGLCAPKANFLWIRAEHSHLVLAFVSLDLPTRPTRAREIVLDRISRAAAGRQPGASRVRGHPAAGTDCMQTAPHAPNGRRTEGAAFAREPYACLERVNKFRPRHFKKRFIRGY